MPVASVCKVTYSFVARTMVDTPVFMVSRPFGVIVTEPAPVGIIVTVKSSVCRAAIIVAIESIVTEIAPALVNSIVAHWSATVTVREVVVSTTLIPAKELMFEAFSTPVASPPFPVECIIFMLNYHFVSKPAAWLVN